MSRTIPGHVDSIGKLLERIALVAKEPVVHNGKQLRTPPDEIFIAANMVREFRCVSGCTACCLPFTLDFTPEEYDGFEMAPDIEEQALDLFSTRPVTVNGEKHTVVTYEQYKDPSCPFLRPTREGGALGCGFWTEDNSTQPLECAAAPQLLMTTRGEGRTYIMKKPFGRGWAWKDKPQCEFDPVIDKVSNIPENYDLSNEIMLLERYHHWANHFGIDTYLPQIVETMNDLPEHLRASNLASVQVV